MFFISKDKNIWGYLGFSLGRDVFILRATRPVKAGEMLLKAKVF